MSLLGGLIIAAADTAGKPSLAWRGRRAAQHVSAIVAAAVPGVACRRGGRRHAPPTALSPRKIGHGLAIGAERGRELADAAVERTTELAGELAQRVRERGPEVADAARARAEEFAPIARERGRSWPRVCPGTLGRPGRSRLRTQLDQRR